jgi:DNA ligase-1
VRTPNRLAETSRRLEKIEHLARGLHGVDDREIEIGVAYLAGDLPQGPIGIGPAVLARAECAPAPAATLALVGVDDALGELRAPWAKGRRRSEGGYSEYCLPAPRNNGSGS